MRRLFRFWFELRVGLGDREFLGDEFGGGGRGKGVECGLRSIFGFRFLLVVWSRCADRGFNLR